MRLEPIIFPAAVAMIGALLYALAENPKASEMGKLAYAAGVLVLTFVLATYVIGIRDRARAVGRHAKLVADVSVTPIKCHDCAAQIPARTVLFMRSVSGSDMQGPAFQSVFPICRACGEHELARRIRELKP